MINGQKMFTTFAHRADYCFATARSDPHSRGPTALRFRLRRGTPGIEIQAVQRWVTGANIVFYTDVRIADSYRIGELDQGLRVLRTALEAEQNVAPASRTGQLFALARSWAAATPDHSGGTMLDDVLVRERLARLAIDAEVTELLGYRVAFLEELGAKPGPHAALYGPETYVKWSKEMIDMVGPTAMVG